MRSACSRSTAWLLALIKCEGWLPNHVIALEALCPMGFTSPPSDRFIITTKLPQGIPSRDYRVTQISFPAAA